LLLALLHNVISKGSYLLSLHRFHPLLKIVVAAQWKQSGELDKIVAMYKSIHAEILERLNWR